MSDEPRRLRPADEPDPLDQLRSDLPDAWQGPVIGPEIRDWRIAPGAHKDNLNLSGIPAAFQVEMAWMAHWQQLVDGTPASVQPLNQFAHVLRRASPSARNTPSRHSWRPSG